jgi:flagellar basal-body rod modification protein FlgD
MSAGAIGGTSPDATQAAGGAFGSLKTGDFLKVMMSELSHQDPFQPQDSSKLLEQFSSLRNIESQLSLQDSIQSLVLQNQVSSAGGMIGKLVAGLDADNDQVAGLVTSVLVQNGKVMLELDTGKSLAMDRVTQLANLEPNTAAAPAAAATAA